MSMYRSLYAQVTIPLPDATNDGRPKAIQIETAAIRLRNHTLDYLLQDHAFSAALQGISSGWVFSSQRTKQFPHFEGDISSLPTRLQQLFNYKFAGGRVIGFANSSSQPSSPVEHYNSELVTVEGWYLYTECVHVSFADSYTHEATLHTKCFVNDFPIRVWVFPPSMNTTSDPPSPSPSSSSNPPSQPSLVFIAHAPRTIRAELERLQLLFLMRLKDSLSLFKSSLMKFLTLPSSVKQQVEASLSLAQEMLKPLDVTPLECSSSKESSSQEGDSVPGEDTLRMEEGAVSPNDSSTPSSSPKDLLKGKALSASVAGCVVVEAVEANILLPSLVSSPSQTGTIPEEEPIAPLAQSTQSSIDKTLQHELVERLTYPSLQPSSLSTKMTPSSSDASLHASYLPPSDSTSLLSSPSSSTTSLIINPKPVSETLAHTQHFASASNLRSLQQPAVKVHTRSLSASNIHGSIAEDSRSSTPLEPMGMIPEGSDRSPPSASPVSITISGAGNTLQASTELGAPTFFAGSSEKRVSQLEVSSRDSSPLTSSSEFSGSVRYGTREEETEDGFLLIDRQSRPRRAQQNIQRVVVEHLSFRSSVPDSPEPTRRSVKDSSEQHRCLVQSSPEVLVQPGSKQRRRPPPPPPHAKVSVPAKEIELTELAREVNAPIEKAVEATQEEKIPDHGEGKEVGAAVGGEKQVSRAQGEEKEVGEAQGEVESADPNASKPENVEQHIETVAADKERTVVPDVQPYSPLPSVVHVQSSQARLTPSSRTSRRSSRSSLGPRRMKSPTPLRFEPRYILRIQAQHLCALPNIVATDISVRASVDSASLTEIEWETYKRNGGGQSSRQRARQEEEMQEDSDFVPVLKARFEIGDHVQRFYPDCAEADSICMIKIEGLDTSLLLPNATILKDFFEDEIETELPVPLQIRIENTKILLREVKEDTPESWTSLTIQAQSAEINRGAKVEGINLFPKEEDMQGEVEELTSSRVYTDTQKGSGEEEVAPDEIVSSGGQEESCTELMESFRSFIKVFEAHVRRHGEQLHVPQPKRVAGLLNALRLSLSEEDKTALSAPPSYSEATISPPSPTPSTTSATGLLPSGTAAPSKARLIQHLQRLRKENDHLKALLEEKQELSIQLEQAKDECTSRTEELDRVTQECATVKDELLVYKQVVEKQVETIQGLLST